METFTIFCVAGAVLVGCGIGIASLTNKNESAEDERLRQELAWRENNRRMRGDQ